MKIKDDFSTFELIVLILLLPIMIVLCIWAGIKEVFGQLVK